ncbi:cupin domain-containing protein (plasmid) [Nostoc sp. UHCC 0926]|uniref:cupin domain-containing protein n=1 Tax=Nostoc sp. UHCC 0926 TaxID=3025190 RepID=UPI002360DB9A|nr:cupin domain-containing protein [Nostoc sp. UHCC 0926]WDD36748.1 cupin domain-containing protein [Nostoc sp. UHCC 0926]
METILKSIAVPSGEGKSFLVLPGETMTLKATSADTDGAYTLIEVTDEPQAGPPFHLHRREDESFYILEGTFAFQIGVGEASRREASLKETRTVTATAGCFITAPKGVPHSYKNIGTTPARMLTLFVPAGIENFFEDLSKLTAAGTLDIDSIAAVAAMQGMELVPPPPEH